MNIMEKLLQAFKKIPPTIKNSLEDNQYSNTLAYEPLVTNRSEEDYKNISLELWRIIEDIEKAETVTNDDNPAFRSIILELTEKRHVYMSLKEVDVLVKEKIQNADV